MEKSVRGKIEAAARQVVLGTFTNPTENDYQAILSGMLKAYPDLLRSANEIVPEPERDEVDQVIINGMKKAARLVFEPQNP